VVEISKKIPHRFNLAYNKILWLHVSENDIYQKIGTIRWDSGGLEGCFRPLPALVPASLKECRGQFFLIFKKNENENENS